MCTLTWFTTEAGYELFFNRDERITRHRAQPPSAQTTSGVHYLSPTDADAGGTWITANEFGVTVCLLNHYQFEQLATYQAWVSRGEIVRAFADTQNLAVAERKFSAIKLDDFRAFRMFVIDPQGNNRLFVWDGHTARMERNVSMPKSSSSVDAKHVKAQRRALFNDLALADSKQVDDYLSFHASHDPYPCKESVCMHREDANTVSLSYVSVDQDQVAFRYADGPPCTAELKPALTLALLDPVQAARSSIAVL